MTETDYTTITVRESTKERLDKEREGQPWDQYLEKLRREHADPLTMTGVEQIAEVLVGELEDTSNTELPVADIREAAREGAREAIAELEGRP